MDGQPTQAVYQRKRGLRVFGGLGMNRPIVTLIVGLALIPVVATAVGLLAPSWGLEALALWVVVVVIATVVAARRRRRQSL